MHRRLPVDVERAYDGGNAHALQRAATVMSLTGAALTLAARGRRLAVTRAGGLLVAAGAACQRFAVYEAGKASAADPRATIRPQLAARAGSLQP